MPVTYSLPPSLLWDLLKSIFEWTFALVWFFFTILWPVWFLFIIFILIRPFIRDRSFEIFDPIKDKFKRRFPNFGYRGRSKMSETYIDENGYKRYSDSNKLVSRWVAEKKLDRELYDEEVVHHKNRNKLDNRSGNLRVFGDQDEHESYHEEAGDFDD